MSDLKERLEAEIERMQGIVDFFVDGFDENNLEILKECYKVIFQIDYDFEISKMTEGRRA